MICYGTQILMMNYLLTHSWTIMFFVLGKTRMENYPTDKPNKLINLYTLKELKRWS